METLAETLTPGTPVYSRDRRGFVAAVERNESRSFTVGTGSMRPVLANLTIVWDRGGISPDIPDTMAEDWAAEARRIGLPFVEDHAERYAAERKARTDSWQRQQEERAAAEVTRAEWVADAVTKIPADAKAVIVGEFQRDESDSMSDYFSAKTERVVILAFSTHTRDLFPELRKAALNHPETAPLADAPDTAEHREKWSMGAGYYLATGGRYSTGWKVRKRSISGDTPEARAKSLPMGEWSLAEAAPTSADPVPVGAFTIEQHTHTKRGFDMWICILPGRVERDEFDRLRDAAEALGGWYSKPWGKTPGGFAFKVEADALAFANAEPSAAPPDGAVLTPPAVTSRPGIGDKLRALADAMQGDIDRKLGDRLANTPKRQREAGVARQEGARLQRTQKGLRALAEMHDAGTVPPDLARVTTKAAAYDLARSIISDRQGYYDSGHDTGKPALDTPAALAFWALIGGQSEAERKAEELRQKIEALQFANIPGYFPTPAEIVARMIEAADLPTGHAFKLLEPEGGSGAILDRVRLASSLADMVTYERHVSLRAILDAKGYRLAGSDFLEAAPVPEFDRVLMNPPFENGQDMEHVRHAFAFLKPGGRLVAIMSPGPFFRQGRKESEFREWFEEIGGTREDIPAGAFKASGTGVATVLVVLDKDGAAPVEPPARASNPLTVGTSHFVSIATARDYYARQGDDAATVLDKLAEGAIHIGPPEVREGQRVEIIPGEGRYSIVEG